MIPAFNFVENGEHLLRLRNKESIKEPLEVDKFAELFLLKSPSSEMTNTIILRSGDFIVSSLNQKFYTGGNPVTLAVLVSLKGGAKVDLAPLHKRMWAINPFATDSISYIVALARSHPIVGRTKKVASILFKYWFLSKRIELDWESASLVRNVASLHGYNLKRKENRVGKGHFVLSVRRPKKALIRRVDLYKESEVYKISIRNSRQRYVSSGFILTN